MERENVKPIQNQSKHTDTFLSNILSHKMEEQRNPQCWFYTDYQYVIRTLQASLAGCLRADKHRLM